MIVDLGCGNNKRDSDAIGVDIRDYPDVDVVADITDEIPFEDNEVSRVLAYSILEHVADLPALMREIHRVVEPGGIVEGKVPHYTDTNAYTDPTHKQFFSLETWNYWDSRTELGQRDYFNVEYRIRECRRVRRLQFWRDRPIYFELEVIE